MGAGYSISIGAKTFSCYYPQWSRLSANHKPPNDQSGSNSNLVIGCAGGDCLHSISSRIEKKGGQICLKRSNLHMIERERERERYPQIQDFIRY